MKYYIADIHFGHRNVLKFENRPFETVEEMDEEYIRRWNSKVRPGDEVYILGDFSFYKGAKTMEILKRLSGMKFLIVGNHDHLFLADKEFDQSLFRWIKDTTMIKDGGYRISLFHYPIQVWNEQHHGALHLYGHVHSNSGTMHPLWYDVPNSYNVGIDIWRRTSYVRRNFNISKQKIAKVYRKIPTKNREVKKDDGYVPSIYFRTCSRYTFCRSLFFS